MFGTVLVANRGEIAVRVIRTLRTLGVRSVAVYSDADARARHVREADVAVRIGPAPAAESYLHVERILDAARQAGAQAVHPGYGFLSENAGFAASCERAGLVFVGPSPAAIDAMGDKIRAKQTVQAAGVPVVPGSHGPGMSDDELVAAAHRTGFPVLLKPSAGGGGKGMRTVFDPDALADAIAAARREARAAFGDDTLLVERFVATPRHIEIQVLGDRHGTVLHLGERECSLQRRHQKVVEEAPSPLLDETTRQRMGAAAVQAARAVGYIGAGTVEFIVSGEDGGFAGSSAPRKEYFFMEMNARLQVEHPVTELVTGLDLVELQLRVAAGQPLPFGQDEVALCGHAVEARVYAEDPSRGFLPTGGRVLALHEPAPSARRRWPSACEGEQGPPSLAPVSGALRVDSGLRAGDTVGSEYDPMLAKVIAAGPDRAAALRRLDAALAQTVILGLGTNLGFLRDLLALPAVADGTLDTGLVERCLDELVGDEVPTDVLAAAALARLLRLEPDGGVVDPFDIPGGWRLGEPAPLRLHIRPVGHEPIAVAVRGRAADAQVTVAAAAPLGAHAAWDGPDAVTVSLNGLARRYACAVDGDTVWLGRDGHAWALAERERLDAERADQAGAGGQLRAPMPGTVTTVEVVDGQRVSAGQRLLIVEAMKMEHPITAPVDGWVRELRVTPGQPVSMDAPLVAVEAQARTWN